MCIRESRLLIVAVALGALVAVPLACGGNDNGGNDQNGDTDQHPGDGLHVDGDSADITSICGDIKDKIDGCQAQILCVVDSQPLYDQCVSDGTTSASARDSFVASSCSSISTALCHYSTGNCTGDLVCGVYQATKGFCVTTDGDAPAGAEDCTSTQTCTSQAQICNGAQGGTLSCYDQCAPPACSGGLHCTLVDGNTGDSACLQSDGTISGTATTCDDSPDECTVTQGCLTFNTGAHKYCAERCFLNDGTYLSSIPPTTGILQKH